jgi:hypothetical protein
MLLEYPSLAELSARRREGGESASATPAPAGTYDDAANVVEHMRPALKRCYDSSLHRNPNGSYGSYFVVHINCRGEVVAVVGADTGFDDQARACIVPVFASARFKPESPKDWTILVPVSFIRA